ncbi:MAG: putative N-acetylmannosamine-6-phosphate 2-epimerase [Lachnospiraceae bacterium]|jgi:N-acylglucosamine-6-phosphate 2-epimerase|nr:putative N-acetylmannosamine-6-phosphate 2-epimerase [Lachnospiraceae bacterium]
MTKQEIVKKIENGLIVSCQMERHAPCYTEDIIEIMAKAALWGGACALRINTPENVRKIRALTDVPIIGLTKIFREDTDVFMTPDMGCVEELIEAGADILAIDGTDRLIDGHPAHDIITEIREKYPDIPILADVRDEEDAVRSLKLGADFAAPTFYRFKKNAKSTDVPDWEMFARMCRDCKDLGYVLMEGKVWTPDDAVRALHYGALAVVVGSAITRPHLTARRFYDHMNGFPETRSLLY